jgi:hypothetical protein
LNEVAPPTNENNSSLSNPPNEEQSMNNIATLSHKSRFKGDKGKTTEDGIAINLFNFIPILKRWQG